MSKYRETPCKYYVSYRECSKGREAEHKGYCQHCDKYCPGPEFAISTKRNFITKENAATLLRDTERKYL